MKRLLTILLLITLPVAAQENATPKPQGNDRPTEPRNFGGKIVLNEDDKPAFPAPPAGWDVKCEGSARKLEMIEYESKTVGTTREDECLYAAGIFDGAEVSCAYLLHGIGGNETEGSTLPRRTSSSIT